MHVIVIRSFLMGILIIVISDCCSNNSPEKKAPLNQTPQSINKIIHDATSISDLFTLEKRIDLQTTDSSLLSQIDMAIYHEGDFYIVDRNIGQVLRFDSLGIFINKIGKRGDNYEEVSKLTSVFIVGDTICMIDAGMSKLVLNSKSSKFIGEIAFTAFTPDYGAYNQMHNAIYYITENQPASFKRKYRAVIADLFCTIIKGIAPVEDASMYGTNISALNSSFVDSSGNLWLISKYLSSVEVFDHNGNRLASYNIGGKEDGYMFLSKSTPAQQDPAYFSTHFVLNEMWGIGNALVIVRTTQLETNREWRVLSMNCTFLKNLSGPSLDYLKKMELSSFVIVGSANKRIFLVDEVPMTDSNKLLNPRIVVMRLKQ